MRFRTSMHDPIFTCYTVPSVASRTWLLVLGKLRLHVECYGAKSRGIICRDIKFCEVTKKDFLRFSLSNHFKFISWCSDSKVTHFSGSVVTRHELYKFSPFITTSYSIVLILDWFVVFPGYTFITKPVNWHLCPRKRSICWWIRSGYKQIRRHWAPNSVWLCAWC